MNFFVEDFNFKLVLQCFKEPKMKLHASQTKNQAKNQKEGLLSQREKRVAN